MWWPSLQELRTRHREKGEQGRGRQGSKAWRAGISEQALRRTPHSRGDGEQYRPSPRPPGRSLRSSRPPQFSHSARLTSLSAKMAAAVRSIGSWARFTTAAKYCPVQYRLSGERGVASGGGPLAHGLSRAAGRLTPGAFSSTKSHSFFSGGVGSAEGLSRPPP